MGVASVTKSKADQSVNSVDNTSATSDVELVDRSRSGDMEAYRELVERYQNRAFAVALGVIGNQSDAEDIVQDAFLKAYRNLNNFQGNSSFYTWLYRIVANLAIDYSRKRYRKAEVSVGEMAAKDSDPKELLDNLQSLLGEDNRFSPEHSVVRDEIRTNLKSAIDRLSPEHRSVIFLREIEGLSYEEISDVVGCSKGTVMSRLHHARKKLKASLSTLFESYMEGVGSKAR
jgi:RNA polymerase sigma-70 factor (ECF subfamily)